LKESQHCSEEILPEAVKPVTDVLLEKYSLPLLGVSDIGLDLTGILGGRMAELTIKVLL